MAVAGDIRQGLLAARLRERVMKVYAKQIEGHGEKRARLRAMDPIDWMEQEFYIPSTEAPIKLYPWQKGILRLALERDEEGHFRWSTVLYGTVKKSGKALDVETPICTPDGWSTMGELRVGDQVFAGDGSACRVTSAFPVMFERPCYAVRFGDDAELIADAEHQWVVRSLDRGGKPRNQEWVRTTAQLAEHMRYGAAWNHSIAISGSLALPEIMLPVPPYALGAWLGDGDTAAGRITCSETDSQIIDEIRGEGVAVRPHGTPMNYGLPGLVYKLREIGVLGNKHIPALYQRGSAAQRLALLQGLMDTDGTVATGRRFSGEKGRCELTLTCKPLVDGAVELIRGLGLKPSIRESRAMLNGRDVGPRWRIAFTAFAEQPVFRLERKRARLPTRAERQMKKLRSLSRQIVSIESVASRPVRCITVDSLSSTFLAGRELIPTHNSTVAGAVARWTAETQTRYGEIYAVGNDFQQARDRAFKEAKFSVELTPGYLGGRGVLPGRWDVHQTYMKCHLTGSTMSPVGMDPKGEAGGHPSLSVWTELWAMETTEAKRLWDEMTRDPTQPNSVRWVETYAGYDGESMLLYGLYESVVHKGRQYTNEEFARAAARDVDGERYEDFLFAFAETEGDPAAPVPIYVNEPGGIFGYWDEGLNARRFPWQDERYYREEEATLPEAAYRRLHLNEWVGAESDFVPIAAWDDCYDADLPEMMPVAIVDGRKVKGEAMVLSLDAAATGDCFGIVGVTRHPLDRLRPAIRKYKVYRPEDFPDKRIDFLVVEQFIREVCRAFNVVQICYDPYQLEDMMQRLRRDRVAWCEEFTQGTNRLEADRGLYDLIIQGRLAHMEDPANPGELRQHIINCNAKLQKDEDSKLRIVKRSVNRKIDLAVAASMGVARAMYLNL